MERITKELFFICTGRFFTCLVMPNCLAVFLIRLYVEIGDVNAHLLFSRPVPLIYRKSLVMSFHRTSA